MNYEKHIGYENGYPITAYYTLHCNRCFHHSFRHIDDGFIDECPSCKTKLMEGFYVQYNVRYGCIYEPIPLNEEPNEIDGGKDEQETRR